MRNVIWIACAAAAIGGCAHAPSSSAGATSRPERFANESPRPAANSFVGVWTSPAKQTVNDWIAIFTEDGYCAIDGPGLKADGTYVVHGNIAEVRFSMRNGRKPPVNLAGTRVVTNPPGTIMVFSTGIPAEAPVELYRSGGSSASQEPELDPITLM